MLRYAILSTVTALAGLAVATSVSAEPFKCPHVGGNFTFGQEANINSLDQMASSTISTRNIAMNMFESLMTRDENFNEHQDMPDGKGGTIKKRVMNTYALASLGGATMDNEWNYVQCKLMRALGVVQIENQARI